MTDNTDLSPFGFYHENALNLVDRLEKEFDDTTDLVDVIITSPPYADLIDYGDDAKQIGKQSYESFLEDLQEVFKQCYEVATDDATLWIITDTYRKDGRLVRLPFDIADDIENLHNVEVCQADDCDGVLFRDRQNGHLHCPECGSEYDPTEDSWRMGDHIIWNKQRTRPWRQKGQLRNIYEHISMYSESDEYTYNIDDIRITDTDNFGRWWVDYPERYNPAGMVPGNVWEYPLPKQGDYGPKVSFHPSPFPAEMIERILDLTTEPEDVVLDPFGGVGTTLAVAEARDRNPIGFELNEEYIDYWDQYVRKTIRDELGYTQETLPNTQQELPQIIWTLRAHKYAFKLYRQLIQQPERKSEPDDDGWPFDLSREEWPTDIGADTIPDVKEGTWPPKTESEIEFILAQTTLEYEEADGQGKVVSAEQPPTTHLCYVCQDSVDIDSVPVQAARNGLISDVPGSGDYYEVEFEVDVIDTKAYRDAIEGDSSPVLQDESVYIYTGGHHFWYNTPTTVADWHEDVRAETWQQYRVRNWAPLVSNLKLRVENPLNDAPVTESSRQADIQNYSG